MTEFLPLFVSTKLVDADIATNDARSDNEQIRGLEEWVMLRRPGTSDKSLLPLLKTLLAFGPDQARQARERLTAKHRQLAGWSLRKTGVTIFAEHLR